MLIEDKDLFPNAFITWGPAVQNFSGPKPEDQTEDYKKGFADGFCATIQEKMNTDLSNAVDLLYKIRSVILYENGGINNALTLSITKTLEDIDD